MVRKTFTFENEVGEKVTVDNPIFHYTSIDALCGIVNKSGLHFRATRYDSMNDSEEYRWVYDSLKARISKEHAISVDEVNELYKKFPYVISFSTENGQEMWERYGNHGKGVCLVLDKKKLIAASERNFGKEWDVVMPVMYANEDNKMEKLAEAVVQYHNFGYGTDNQSEDFEDDIYCSAFVKDEAKWGVETELRYARIRENNLFFKNGDTSSSEDKHDVQYYIRGGKRIPYLAVNLPLEVFGGVIVGSEMDDLEFEKIKEMMIDNGFGEERVMKSDVKFK